MSPVEAEKVWTVFGDLLCCCPMPQTYSRDLSVLGACLLAG